MSELKTQVAKHIKSHQGVWTSDIILNFSEGYTIEEIIDVLDSLLDDGLVKAVTSKKASSKHGGKEE